MINPNNKRRLLAQSLLHWEENELKYLDIVDTHRKSDELGIELIQWFADNCQASRCSLCQHSIGCIDCPLNDQAYINGDCFLFACLDCCVEWDRLYRRIKYYLSVSFEDVRAVTDRIRRELYLHDNKSTKPEVRF